MRCFVLFMLYLCCSEASLPGLFPTRAEKGKLKRAGRQRRANVSTVVCCLVLRRLPCVLLVFSCALSPVCFSPPFALCVSELCSLPSLCLCLLLVAVSPEGRIHFFSPIVSTTTNGRLNTHDEHSRHREDREGKR